MEIFVKILRGKLSLEHRKQLSLKLLDCDEGQNGILGKLQVEFKLFPNSFLNKLPTGWRSWTGVREKLPKVMEINIWKVPFSSEIICQRIFPDHWNCDRVTPLQYFFKWVIPWKFSKSFNCISRTSILFWLLK